MTTSKSIPDKPRRVHYSVYLYRGSYILRNDTVRDGHKERWQVNIRGVTNNRCTRAECMRIIDYYRETNGQ